MSAIKEESSGEFENPDSSYSQYDGNASYFGQPSTYAKPESVVNASSGNGVTADPQSYDEHLDDSNAYQMDDATRATIEELKTEISRLDNTFEHKHAIRLLKAEIERLTYNMEPDYLEVDVPKQIRIVRKVTVPVGRNPKFNFVGKLLGPGGKTLQSLIHSTRCRIYILGKGSSREKGKEEELLASGDPKYAHLKDPLYVRVEASGPAAVAYQKIAHVLHELQYYLQPVKDDIYMQQMADMGKPFAPPPGGPGMRPPRGALMGAAPPMRPPLMGGRGGGPPRGGGAPRGGRGYLMQTPPGVAPTPQGPPPPPPAPAPAPPPNNYVTYPGYDYGGYGEYQQAAPPNHSQPPTHMPPPMPPPNGPVGPPIPPPAPPTGPPPNGPAPSYAYPTPYGYDYSQQHQQPPPQPPPQYGRGGGKAPRPPLVMSAAGSGKPTGGGHGRGRGMGRPGPY